MFNELECPREIAFGAIGGPAFSTQVNEGFSGFEQRNRNWQFARGKWKLSLDHKPYSYFLNVYNFWLNQGGKADGFRLLDLRDYQAVNQPLALLSESPQTNCVWQLQNTYVCGSRTYTRTITKPITSAIARYDGTYCANTVSIYVNGVQQTSGWTLDPTTGLVTFTNAPAATPTATFQFHFPARFDTDECNARIEESDTVDGEALISWTDVPIIELRLIAGAGSLGS